MKFTFIVASNSDEVLHSCLLASPDLREGVEICVQRGAASAGAAYNRGIDATRGEVMVFAHQDLYLPAGWLGTMERQLKELERGDSVWGVVGLLGVGRDGETRGRVYSTGLGRVVGGDSDGIAPVETLDEVALIVRRDSGLRFDERLAGFHLYGTDICLQASARSLKVYAAANLGIHNSNGIGLLPRAYWTCWLQLRRKWRSQLPIATPCMPITRWGGPALRYLVGHALWLMRNRHQVSRRAADPSAVWQRLRQAGMAI